MATDFFQFSYTFKFMLEGLGSHPGLPTPAFIKHRGQRREIAAYGVHMGRPGYKSYHSTYTLDGSQLLFFHPVSVHLVSAVPIKKYETNLLFNVTDTLQNGILAFC